jgi:hypothetical protein
MPLAHRLIRPLTTGVFALTSLLVLGEGPAAAAAAPIIGSAFHHTVPAGHLTSPRTHHAVPGHRLRHDPVITDTSTNWAGYALSGSTYTSVSASWVEPKVKCTTGDQYSSFWVGLDGFTTDSVEQTGTEADCSDGTPTYAAWYEMYPADPVTCRNAVKPGDHLTATVTYEGSDKYSLKLADTTAGWIRTANRTQDGLARASAEVVAEAPYNGGVLPLADFGRVRFSSATVDGAPLGSADPTGIEMVTDAGEPAAAISPITGTTSGAFSVAWKNS